MIKLGFWYVCIQIVLVANMVDVPELKTSSKAQRASLTNIPPYAAATFKNHYE